MASLRIVFLCVISAVLFGIIQDQVTARLCVEYFSVFHPRIVASNDPTILAFVWGVVATWWVGVLIGIPLAISARWGRRPKLTARRLVFSILCLFGFTASMSVSAGFLAYWAVSSGRVDPLVAFRWLDGRISQERQIWFLVDLAAHNAAYFGGAVGGFVLCIATWVRRDFQPID